VPAAEIEIWRGGGKNRVPQAWLALVLVQRVHRSRDEAIHASTDQSRLLSSVHRERDKSIYVFSSVSNI
jgi:hypothetical protein